MSASQARTQTPSADRGEHHADVRSPDSADLAHGAPEPGSGRRQGDPGTDLARILKLSVPVLVVLAEQEMSIQSILEMTVGTIIEFDVPFDAPLELKVANQPIGHGHAVKVGEYFGVRITSIDSVPNRIDAMSGP